MKIKLVKKGNKLQTLTKGINDLNNESVEIGHFQESGKHYSGFTYAELMAIHHNPIGNGLDIPPRPVLDILSGRNKRLDNPKIKAILRQYSKLEPKEQTNAWLLDQLGIYMTDAEKEIFGSSALAPNAGSTVSQKGKNSPLIDTTSLRDKTSYRTSKDKNIKGT